MEQDSKLKGTGPSSSELEAFQYEILPPGKDHIRLLTILPGSTRPRETFHCTLETHALEEAPPYRALSYVWGTTSQNQTIICSEKELKVTPSLHATLLLLRDKWLTLECDTATGSTSRLWVDQICINQKDESERAQQVRIMRTIYQKASLTLISLGEDFNSDIGSLVSDFVEQVQKLSRSPRSLCENPHLQFPKDELLRFWGLPVRADKLWPALRSAMSFPYFERVWVVQEVLMARDAVIVYLEGIIRWDRFLDAFCFLKAKNFHMLDATFQNPQDEIRCPQILDTYWESKRFPKEWRLYDLVCRTSELESTDSRDKIFALAGLAHDGKEIEISYTKSRMQVFEEFARHSMNSERSLKILSYAQPAYVEDRGKPSWVPRWDKRIVGPSLLNRRFDAAFGTKASLDLHQVQGILNLSGLEIDVVTVEARFAGEVSWEKAWEKWTANLYDAFVKVASIIPERTPKSVVSKKLRDMTWCLVLGNYFDQEKYGSSHEADDALLDDFCAYIFQIFRLFGFYHQKEEAASRLLPLARAVFEAHHKPPISIESPSASAAHTYDWLKEAIPSLDPTLFQDPQNVDEFALYIVTVVSTQPMGHTRFDLACEAEGAIGWPGRSLFGTGKGFIGVGPPQLERDDVICVLFGGPTLYVLRPTSVPGEYTYLGDCYVHGQMHGEALNSSQAKDKWFRLV